MTGSVEKWKIVYTKQAKKDAKKLSAAGLRPKAEQLLKILRENPYQKPPFLRETCRRFVWVPVPGELTFSIDLFIRSLKKRRLSK